MGAAGAPGGGGGSLFDQANFYADFTVDQMRVGATWMAASTGMTTVRATGAYGDDAAGNWSNFAINVPVITNRGLRGHGTRINSIRNNSMQGVVPGTPGTPPTNWSFAAGASALSSQIVAVGTENGIDYIDLRIFGTAAASGTPTIFLENVPPGIVAAAGQTWTMSGFITLTNNGGTAPSAHSHSFREYQSTTFLGNVTGGFVTFPAGGTPLGKARTAVAAVVANASTDNIRPSISINVGNGFTYDFTLRIGWPQCELGGTPTSPIRTTSVAVQRNQESIIVPGVTIDAGQGTLFAETVQEYDDPLSDFRGPICIDDTTSNNYVNLIQRSLDDTWQSAANSGGAGTLASAVGPFAYGAISRAAVTFGLDDMRSAVGGVVSGSVDVSGAMPIGMTTLRVSRGTPVGAGQDGIMRRLAYWPVKLTNAQLQALTAP